MEDETSPVVTSAEIPLDLLHEIMSRLPTKSVVRFNCVSKLWHTYFTITTFLLRHSRSSPTVSPNTYYHGVCSTHHKRTSPNRTLKVFSFEVPNHGKPTNQARYSVSTAAVVKLTASVPLPTLPFKVFPYSVGVSNFCDDLVCVYEYYDVSQVILVSAQVQDFFPLPKTSLCSPYDDDFSRQHWCSLGFEPTRGEYRVLRSIRTLKDHTRYEILTLGSNSWKLLDAANIPSSICIQGEFTSEIIGSMCLNGVIYWVQRSRSVFGIVVASFDLASEEFRAFNGNKMMGRSFDFNDEYYLAPLDGHPALFVSNRNHPGELLYWRQWTLSDNGQDSNLVCHRRIVPFYVWDCTLQALPIVGGSTVIRKRANNKRYYCYDIEKDANWAIETEGDCEVLQIS